MTVVQHMKALDRANAVRLRRARIRADIESAPTSEAASLAAGQILCPDPWCESWNVRDLLCRIPRVGRGRAIRMLRRSAVPEWFNVGELTDRQRERLVTELGAL